MACNAHSHSAMPADSGKVVMRHKSGKHKDLHTYLMLKVYVLTQTAWEAFVDMMNSYRTP